MNCLALLELNLESQTSNGDALRLTAHYVHFNAAQFFVVGGPVTEGPQVEVAFELPVDSCQKIKIESCRDPQGIIVGIFEYPGGLPKIGAQEESVSHSQHAAQR